MKSLKSTCGLPNSGWIYFIGLASLVEALVIAIAYVFLISDINRIGSWTTQNYWINWLSTPYRMSWLILALSCVRILVSIALLIGRYKKMLSVLAVYIIFTLISIICHIIAGSIAIQYSVSYNMGIATVSIIALSIGYVSVAIAIFNKERKILSDAPVNPPVVQAPVSTVQYVPDSQHAPPLPMHNTPHLLHAPLSDQHTSPPFSPPTYSEYDTRRTPYAGHSEDYTKKSNYLN